MANIVKITDVHLYVGIRTVEGAAECARIKLMLDAANIKYVTLAYGDDSQHDGLFGALNTWGFSRSSQRKVNFTDFPIVHWTEYYDDYEKCIETVSNSTDLANSNLIKCASLVQK